jgi:hypothetical protein
MHIRHRAAACADGLRRPYRPRAALVEARAVILTVVSNAMILESDYDPSQHPVIKQIDAALAKAKEPAISP